MNKHTLTVLHDIQNDLADDAMVLRDVLSLEPLSPVERKHLGALKSAIENVRAQTLELMPLNFKR